MPSDWPDRSFYLADGVVLKQVGGIEGERGAEE